jgi:hypothetical protein
MPTGLRTVLGLVLGGFVGLVGPWVVVYALAATEGKPANLGGAQGGGFEVFACSMVCGLGGAVCGALIGGALDASLRKEPPGKRQRPRPDEWDDHGPDRQRDGDRERG